MFSGKHLTRRHTITNITRLSKLSRKSDNRLTKLLENIPSSNSNSNSNSNNDNIKNEKVKNAYLMNGFRIRVYDYKNTISIKIGSKKEICINLVITKDTNTAELNLFNYYPSCDIFQSLEHKRGTNLMMNTLIHFLKAKYPNVNEIILFDASRYKCNNTNKFWFSLYDYYLFKYDSTYYIHNYNFAFIEKIDVYTHENNKKLIRNFTVDKKLLEKYLHENIPKEYMTNLDDIITQFLDSINDNELATDFIKRFKFNKYTCCLLRYFFYFVKENIPEYHSLMYTAILLI